MSQLAIRGEFFAPVNPDLLGGLLTACERQRSEITRIAAIMSGSDVLPYFAKACTRDHYQLTKLFDHDPAQAQLDASYWDKALKLTDVLDFMPTKRREEWFDSIREAKTPVFIAENVLPTISGLLADRQRFLAEKVDGIFQGLSGDHVTNRPEGFGKRMILANVTDKFGFTASRGCGFINDLRSVIAKFMGRDEPHWNATGRVVAAARSTPGEWVSVDGGALRIRCYIKGTAHLEVHPEMVWRLNDVLAFLYPMAIPPAARKRPAKVGKEWPVIEKPLPFAVLQVLEDMSKQRGGDWWVRCEDKHLKRQVHEVLKSIGGVIGKAGDAVFDYDPRSTLQQMVVSGLVPDAKSHQFYPTPEHLAQLAVALACIQDGETTLEPSAGQGGIAEHMPAGVKCLELSELHCEILHTKGLDVEQGDFLQWLGTADVVVMNPPFSQGRWQAHLDHALAVAGRRVVAVLPESARKQVTASEWHGPFENEFDGTGVSVVIGVFDV